MLSGGRGGYPIPVVRLALLSQMVGDLNLDVSTIPPSLEFAGGKSEAEVAAPRVKLLGVVRNDLKAVAAVSNAVLTGPLPGLDDAVSLTDVMGWSRGDWTLDKVTNWRDSLLGRAPLVREESLSAARYIISGAVAAWIEISAIGDEGQRDQRRAALSANLLEILPLCREGKTRAATAARPAPARDLGAEFASLLRQTSLE